MAQDGERLRIRRVERDGAGGEFLGLREDVGIVLRPALADQEEVPVGVPGEGGRVVGLEEAARFASISRISGSTRATTSAAISSCRASRSPASRSKRSAQTTASGGRWSVRRSVTRTRSPARCTVPEREKSSSSAPSVLSWRSAAATEALSTSTSQRNRASAAVISPARPSETSASPSPPRTLKGRTPSRAPRAVVRRTGPGWEVAISPRSDSASAAVSGEGAPRKRSAKIRRHSSQAAKAAPRSPRSASALINVRQIGSCAGSMARMRRASWARASAVLVAARRAEAASRADSRSLRRCSMSQASKAASRPSRSESSSACRRLSASGRSRAMAGRARASVQTPSELSATVSRFAMMRARASGPSVSWSSWSAWRSDPRAWSSPRRLQRSSARRWRETRAGDSRASTARTPRVLRDLGSSDSPVRARTSIRPSIVMRSLKPGAAARASADMTSGPAGLLS